jgi:hypothetical protein
MKPTMRDVAAVACVSLATVDRVRNNRPRVREETRQKVKAAMDRLGFARDLAAANLARQRVYRFDFILPDNDNAFMKSLRSELLAARERSGFEHTLINLVDVPAFDDVAIEAALADALDRRPDGVAFVAVDSDRVEAVARRLMIVGVGIVTLVSDVSENARNPLCWNRQYRGGSHGGGAAWPLRRRAAGSRGRHGRFAQPPGPSRPVRGLRGRHAVGTPDAQGSRPPSGPRRRGNRKSADL